MDTQNDMLPKDLRFVATRVAVEFADDPKDDPDTKTLCIIELASKRPTISWKVVRDGRVLNRSLGWEYEPLPSSRTDEFKARTRFGFHEAVEFVERMLQQERSNGDRRKTS